MARTKSNPPKPQWFLDSDYSHLQTLEIKIWHEAITKLYRLPALHELGFICPRIGIAVQSDAIKSKSGANAIHSGTILPGTGITVLKSGDQIDVIKVGIGTVQLIEPDRCPGGYWISREQLPVLVVDLQSTDKLIFAELTNKLQEARVKYGTPLSKTGPKVLNSELGNTELAKWRDAKIIQWGELLAWRHSIEPEKQHLYPDRLLGEWLEQTTKEQVKTAKRILKSALACLPELASQFEHILRNER